MWHGPAGPGCVLENPGWQWRGATGGGVCPGPGFGDWRAPRHAERLSRRRRGSVAGALDGYPLHPARFIIIRCFSLFAWQGSAERGRSPLCCLRTSVLPSGPQPVRPDQG